jgi:hypothetical protein
MKDRLMRRLLTCFAVGCLSIAVSRPAEGCSQSFPEWTRGRAFSVKVLMYDQTFHGMRVVLEPEDERKKRNEVEAITDEGGLAHFSGVKPGRYYVEAVRLGITTGSGSVIVQKHGSAEPIEVNWPSRNMYEASTITGTFQHLVVHTVLELAHPQIAAFSAAKLTLSSISSEKTIGTVVSDSEGRFAFPALEPGPYLLHVQEKHPPDSIYPLDDYLVVLLKSESSRTALNLRLSWSSCGMMAHEVE